MAMSNDTYRELVNASWDLSFASIDYQQDLLAQSSDRARPLVADAIGQDLLYEQTRRRRSIASSLGATFPVTFFVFYGCEGADGVLNFTSSNPWRQRSPLPDSTFPCNAATARAFDHFIEDSWIDFQHAWVQEAWRYERARLFPEFGLALAFEPTQVSLRPVQAWATSARWDVDLFGSSIREQAQRTIWRDAIELVKRRPIETAVLSWRTEQGNIERLKMTGTTAEACACLWDKEREYTEHSKQAFEFLSSRGVIDLAP